MANKKTRNLTITFDGKKVTDEERKNAFMDLCRIFMKLSVEDCVSKCETKKERRRVEQNLHDFSLKLLCSIDKSCDKNTEMD